MGFQETCECPAKRRSESYRPYSVTGVYNENRRLGLLRPRKAPWEWILLVQPQPPSSLEDFPFNREKYWEFATRIELNYCQMSASMLVY